jgi:benzil reductase ((S)-benzoin forming)
MDYYYITGSSSGIGKELALQVLARLNTKVFGISRTCTVEHNQYEHIYADLANAVDVSRVIDVFKKEFLTGDNVYLINNAGVVDPIRYVGSFSQLEIQQLLHINLISVIQLINAFLEIPIQTIKSRNILSVSSGAATKIIDGWALYGTAKAGIDHFSLHVSRELKLIGDVQTRIFSVAPGVVNTTMQQRIRAAPLSSFSTKERFVALFNNNELVSAETTALYYLKILDAPEKFTKTVFSLREVYSK